MVFFVNEPFAMELRDFGRINRVAKGIAPCAERVPLLVWE
jgi:hypothetical protein